MKKFFLLVSMAVAMMAQAQVLEVASVQQLPTAKGDVKVAGIAPDGSYVLLTSGSNVGLQRFDIASGQTTTISTAVGAGYNVQVSADGQQVRFRETSFTQDRTRMQSLKQKSFGSDEVTTVMAPTRSDRNLAIGANMQLTRPVVSIENQQLMLTIGGSTTVLSPLGTNMSYIWPSVSPDGKKVLFYVCGKGAYVCNLQGKNVQFIGHDVRAPKWYTNDVVVGMNDRDNGEFTTSSEIVAVSLTTGATQVLTSGINAMYPYACQGKIVCSGFGGETYLITVK